jgi:para-nitrobenzyl esterase
MRAVPIPRVVAAQAAITPDQVDLAGPDEPAPGFTGLLWLAPVRDGDIVAEDPLAALAASGAVTLLAGDTEEEGLLYVAGGPAFDEQAQALGAAITEHIFHGPTARLLARHAEVARDATFAYRFTWRSSALGGRLGAAHAIDLPFVFETLDTPGLAGSDDALLGPEGGPAELASAMHAAWVRFVAGGDPGWAPHPHVERF